MLMDGNKNWLFNFFLVRIEFNDLNFYELLINFVIFRMKRNC